MLAMLVPQSGASALALLAVLLVCAESAWRRKPQMRVASRKAARSDSATPSKLSNPGNHCWFNAIAQSLAATIATARPPSCSCSVTLDTHVERVLTILCQHGHVPSELKEAAIKDVVVERSKVEKARGRRGFVGNLLSASGFGRKFGTDFTEHAQDIDIGLAKCILAAAGPKHELSVEHPWFSPVLVRTAPAAALCTAGVYVQVALGKGGACCTHAVAFAFIEGHWWRCNDRETTCLACPPHAELEECSVLFFGEEPL